MSVYPPTVAAIDKGTPVKIIHPVNTEGSGLVVDVNAPVSDWKSFVTWAQRSGQQRVNR